MVNSRIVFLNFLLQKMIKHVGTASQELYSRRTIVVGKVSTLTHEIRNHTVEARALVPEAFLPSAKCAKIFRCLGSDALIEFHDNTASRGSTDANVEKYLGISPYKTMGGKVRFILSVRNTCI
jgi:hypothetical protein